MLRFIDDQWSVQDGQRQRVPSPMKALPVVPMPRKSAKPPLSQQAFLRDAMEQLQMTRDEFALRLGASRRRVDNWLLPSDSAGFRELDPVVWNYVREIVEREAGR